ncbi:MAG: helix-turn-helix transcriptional regulator [Oscillospiraceae bacterium]
MAGVSKQKQKLLIMEQLFKERTDEAHSITGNQLIETLGKMGIKAERKTIYDDIATLCDSGMDIQTTKSGHSNAYYLGERLFTDEELKILSDAVATSKFLTIKKSNELIKKLQSLTSEYKSPALRRSIHIENRTKSFNDGIYRTIDLLHEAIYADSEAEMTYTDVSSADKKKQNIRCVISPYQIVWECERYYVICYCESERINGVCRLRADRMSDVSLGKGKRHTLSEQEELDVRKLKNADSGMSSEDIRIKFSAELIGEMIDRFGEKVNMRQISDNEFYVDVSAKISPSFWGWLFKFGDKAQIVSPDYVRELAEEKLSKLHGLYEQEQ